MVFFFVDVDECLMGSDDCQHQCVNTEGGFTCSCFPGYRLYTEEQPLLIDDIMLLPNKSCYGESLCGILLFVTLYASLV